jgi:hypothetical protein
MQNAMDDLAHGRAVALGELEGNRELAEVVTE